MSVSKWKVEFIALFLQYVCVRGETDCVILDVMRLSAAH